MPAQKLQYGMAMQQGAAPGAGNTFRRPLVGQGMMNSDALPQQVPVRRPIVKGQLVFIFFVLAIPFGEIQQKLLFFILLTLGLVLSCVDRCHRR